jgi:inner membrane protein
VAGPREPRGPMSAARRLALLGLVIFLDVMIRTTRPSYAVLGLLDEPAHLATGALVTAAGSAAHGGLSRNTWIAALASSVLIDLDHLPRALGSDVLTAGTPRPYTHSAATVLCLAIACVATRRRTASPILAGCVIGVSAHLLRDAGTAPVALWWPASDAGVTIPYRVYFAVLVGAAIVARSAENPTGPETDDTFPTHDQRRLLP